MRQLIQPVREPSKDEYIQSLKGHIEQAFMDKFVVQDHHSDLMIDVSAHDMGDHIQVKVFVTKPEIIGEGEALADRLMDELAEEGHKVLIYVRSCISPLRERQLAIRLSNGRFFAGQIQCRPTRPL